MVALGGYGKRHEVVGSYEQSRMYYITKKTFIRMQVRDEVIEILPDLRGVSDYVQYSSYFSRSEIVSIVIRA